MEISELSVGNYIKHKKTGEILQVTEVLSWGCSVKEYGFATADSVDILPIPLTLEILENNGFKSEDGAHYSNKGKIVELVVEEHPFGNYSIHWVKTAHSVNKCGQQCYIDYYIADMDYVHELQNALKLCKVKEPFVL